mmetsp:Transcript_25851/g.39622  ORF Transcript_25851/g.39622 Transcript_25851/m.39622 type:complete len:599 (-) Transcript_25851:343-2139(-)|eukprot:CAMPEP_0194076320 /NCGR_PEP_ID=MMETSP0149-20130528/3138_1 /TAXON_ID=122233 /ORGANISM="Chaetoceros debilis, Strain MM31A-1" /LENGTH=598 /DNA_ID=CAMNT_0038757033 /DNA_START=123 /DNA_END=1919 /DNA_ORIENTATION=+
MTRDSAQVLDKYEDSDWKELPVWVREAAEAIGYTKKLWNRDKEPDVCEMDWEDLNASQQEAAKRLGYSQQVWEAQGEEATSKATSAMKGIRLEDVHKHLKWTIYCIQLYTETVDYQFRVNEDTGLSMHANRVVEAEEVIIQAPVGPSVYEELFEMPQNGNLSDERKGFAERFMEWQRTHQKATRVGAQNMNITIKLEDFSNPPITSKEHRPMPSEDFPNYDMEIFEHEIVIAEFVPSPSKPNYVLPATRRFEILHYDEGLLGLDGEEGYDPSVLKRPPTLCGMEARSLELPGHFSNHASGASSTAFDMMYGSISKEFPPIIGGDLPEWLSKEMAAKERSVDMDKHFPYVFTRRGLKPGTEITTDYSRWHWSHADTSYSSICRRTPIGYFLGGTNRKRLEWDSLSPKIQRATRILGYTQALWESGETTPTFEKSWKKLSLQEQEAAINLTGYNKESWNKDKDSNSESDSSPRISAFDLEWAELSEEQKKAAAIIGYNENNWGEDEDILGDDLYFYNLRPELRDAMVVLGETEATWEEDAEEDTEPWFDCLCGDTDCHSSKEKGGFRGVKYFPLEEQRKLAPLCEPWVQQQISWSMYQLK